MQLQAAARASNLGSRVWLQMAVISLGGNQPANCSQGSKHGHQLLDREGWMLKL